MDADATIFAYLYKIPLVCFRAGATHCAFLSEISSSEIKTLIELSSALILILSPVFKIPIVPPDCASGVIWPTTKPVSYTHLRAHET